MQFDAFAYPAFEQITSHLAKLRNRTRGRVALPVVIRIPFGGGIGGVEHHCDSSEAYYTHTPGLRVVTPGTPADAYRLLRQSIDCPDPVIFLEPKRRYWSKETAALTHGRPGRSTRRWSAGPARTSRSSPTAGWWPPRWRPPRPPSRRAGTSRSSTCARCRRSTTRRWPSRCAAPAAPSSCTRRPGFAGYGAEVAARLTEQCFHYLEAPILRVTGLDIPYPPPQLEQHPPAERRPHPRRASRACSGTTMPDFLLPDLGEGLEEAEIIALARRRSATTWPSTR